MRIFCRQQRFSYLFVVMLLASMASQTQASDALVQTGNVQNSTFNSQSDFNSQRIDFRDESIYFMITTRFYDGDPQNNVLCWDNQAAQKSTKDPC